jgi:hypothetical protein
MIHKCCIVFRFFGLLSLWLGTCGCTSGGAKAAYAHPGRPAVWDWRNVNGHDYTTPVIDQGAQGICGSFSRTEAVQERLSVMLGLPDWNPDLSEADVNFCSGGYPARYILTDGIVWESCYPWVDEAQPCSPCANGSTIRIASWLYVDNDVEAVKEAVYHGGPVVAFMVAYHDFSRYKDGTYHWDGVSGVNNNHSVLLVGYNDEGGYWILQNSWGTEWGMDGFGYVAYGECQIGSHVDWPTFPAWHETFVPLVDG